MASLLQLINILQQLISNLLMHITSSRSWQQALQLLTAGKTAQMDPPAAAVTDWFAQMDPETAHQLLPNPWAASQQAYALHGNVNAVNFATEGFQAHLIEPQSCRYQSRYVTVQFCNSNQSR